MLPLFFFPWGEWTKLNTSAPINKKMRKPITQQDFLEAKKIATRYLENLDETFYYHRKGHTLKGVVPTAIQLAKKEKFSPQEIYLVAIAALFHDTGFTQQYLENEIIGADLAEQFMIDGGFSKQHITLVRNAILSTNLKYTPVTKFEKVLRDADLSALGKSGFWNWMQDLRKEALYYPECHLFQFAKSWDVWLGFEVYFLEQQHQWQTTSAKKMFEKQKEKNLTRLKKLVLRRTYSMPMEE
jgi:predicted metal-dependent HD superfamily phosphohydrolase